MRILLLTPQLPFPPHQGTILRNFHIIKGLASRHEVHLLSMLEAHQTLDSGKIARLKDLCTSIRAVPAPRRTLAHRLWRLIADPRPDMAHRLRSTAFDEALKQVLAGVTFDIVQVEGIELASSIPTIRQASPRSRIIFDDHNAETALQYRAFLTDIRHPTRWIAAFYSYIQARRLARFEAWACESADWVVAVSDADRRQLQRICRQALISTIPNCIDVSEYACSHDDVPRFDVVFSGKMDYRPNVDAVFWFATKIWPHICRVRPHTTWAIVGQRPHPRLVGVGKLDGVTITGRVNKIQPYLSGARVHVMPFRMGSGTRLKLIEAMAAGKAIVSTSLGAEGFPVKDREHLLLADEPSVFAESVLSLLDNAELRSRIGEEAQRFASQYDYRKVIPRFEEIYSFVRRGDAF